MSLFDKVNGQPQMNIQQLQQDPVGAAQRAGYNIPPQLANNPQAMVQHLIQTGQVSNPMLQKIMPMLNKLGGLK
jgi:hypothetical protein